MMAVCLGILGGVQKTHGGICAIDCGHQIGYQCSLIPVAVKNMHFQRATELRLVQKEAHRSPRTVPLEEPQ